MTEDPPGLEPYHVGTLPCETALKYCTEVLQVCNSDMVCTIDIIHRTVYYIYVCTRVIFAGSNFRGSNFRGQRTTT